ncbi:aminoglycoside phosphotransferase [Yinghuangia sp. ASG 101]|uniref:phosphotransferase family protein n=1 Tax=Yinghuangia sp. ASG 101 TaxID=2896848 RepID=UPI001E5FE729|nr:phosphotransferase [Yinghuangia sp. ASG 101]UGQ14687.1 aminoglycoside phosphotransferase [Yinghuangia sp. ASG 101]
MPIRQPWDALPCSVRRAIETEIGAVTSVKQPARGQNSEFSATLRTQQNGAHFVKGVRVDRPYSWSHRNEAAVGPYLPPGIAPTLHWEIENDGWLMLGFELAPGVHPDLSPGSPHLLRVRDLVITIGEELTPCPGAAKHALAERWAEAPGWAELRDRRPGDLDPWALDHAEALAEIEAYVSFEGDTLAHVDLHPGNILVGEDRSVAVDWAWSARGPVWLDPAYLVIRLINAGHSPQQAETWAQDIPAFSAAPDDVLTAFAVRLSGMWECIARSPKARSHARQLADAARQWARHRLTGPARCRPARLGRRDDRPDLSKVRKVYRFHSANDSNGRRDASCLDS